MPIERCLPKHARPSDALPNLPCHLRGADACGTMPAVRCQFANCRTRTRPRAACHSSPIEPRESRWPCLRDHAVSSHITIPSRACGAMPIDASRMRPRRSVPSLPWGADLGDALTVAAFHACRTAPHPDSHCRSVPCLPCSPCPCVPDRASRAVPAVPILTHRLLTLHANPAVLRAAVRLLRCLGDQTISKSPNPRPALFFESGLPSPMPTWAPNLMIRFPTPCAEIIPAS